MGSGRIHSREFKLMVVRQVEQEGKRPVQVCRAHGLAPSLLWRWRQEYAARGELAFSPHQPAGTAALEQRVADLERLVGQRTLENAALKKGLSLRTTGERQAMIAALHAAEPRLSIRRWCRLFGVGRTWYYTRPTAAAHAAHDRALLEAIEAIVLEFPGYGYRRVTAQLHRDGWRVNHRRVLRVMRQESVLCHRHRGFIATTDATHGERRYPNLITGVGIEHLDQVWVADITAIHLPRRVVYLAAILDAHSRCCVGWHLSRRIDTDLTVAALEHALARRQPAPGLIHHSDQGVQYASAAYVARLEQVGAQISMAAVGNPYENAQAESFFKTLKREEVYLNDYQTAADARAQIGHFIEDVYNAKRLHSSLAYLSPLEFEAQLRAHEADVPLPMVR